MEVLGGVLAGLAQGSCSSIILEIPFRVLYESCGP